MFKWEGPPKKLKERRGGGGGGVGRNSEIKKWNEIFTN